jgi:hypothetical protein
LVETDSAKELANLSNPFAVSANRRFQFRKRRQQFIRTHNETLSVVAVRFNNPDCSLVGING